MLPGDPLPMPVLDFFNPAVMMGQPIDSPINPDLEKLSLAKGRAMNLVFVNRLRGTISLPKLTDLVFIHPN